MVIVLDRSLESTHMILVHYVNDTHPKDLSNSPAK